MADPSVEFPRSIIRQRKRSTADDAEGAIRAMSHTRGGPLQYFTHPYVPICKIKSRT
jgi:hypothetical protein